MTKPKTDYCSFCGKHHRAVDALVVQAHVGICDECIELASEMVRRNLSSPPDVSAVHGFEQTGLHVGAGSALNFAASVPSPNLGSPRG